EDRKDCLRSGAREGRLPNANHLVDHQLSIARFSMMRREFPGLLLAGLLSVAMLSACGGTNGVEDIHDGSANDAAVPDSDGGSDATRDGTANDVAVSDSASDGTLGDGAAADAADGGASDATGDSASDGTLGDGAAADAADGGASDATGDGAPTDGSAGDGSESGSGS